VEVPGDPQPIVVGCLRVSLARWALLIPLAPLEDVENNQDAGGLIPCEADPPAADADSRERELPLQLLGREAFPCPVISPGFRHRRGLYRCLGLIVFGGAVQRIE
jgi:hypothetical protein